MTKIIKDIKSLLNLFNGGKNEMVITKSKVLIMPSISEGLSTAMLEAMSSGCVPVVSDVGEMTKAAFDNVFEEYLVLY